LEARERLRPPVREACDVEREPAFDLGHRRMDPEVRRHHADDRPAPGCVPAGDRFADDVRIAVEPALPEVVADHERAARIASAGDLVALEPAAENRPSAEDGQRVERDAAEAEARCAGGPGHGHVDAARDAGADVDQRLALLAPGLVDLDRGWTGAA